MFALLHYQFLQNALFAASLVAIVAAVVGYFLLARGLTFAGHALSHVGFAGAAAGLVAGVDPVFGLLAFTILGAIGIAIFGKRLNERDVAIGIFLSTVLGLGALFISLYTGYAERAYSILFGTILGISRMDILITAVFSLITLLGMAIIFRPLLFASFDPEVAEARGVPVRWLSLIFFDFGCHYSFYGSAGRWYIINFYFIGWTGGHRHAPGARSKKSHCYGNRLRFNL